MNQKYTDKQYEDSGYFEGDDLISHEEYKVVTTRKPHTCMNVDKQHEIKVGTRAVRETAIDSDIGRVSCYVCCECLDKWLDEIL